MHGTIWKGITFGGFWPSMGFPFWVLKILLRFEKFSLNKQVSQTWSLHSYNSKGKLFRPFCMCAITLACKRAPYQPMNTSSSICLVENMKGFEKNLCTVHLLCSISVSIHQFDLLNDFFYLILIFIAKNGSGNTETKQWQDMIAKPRQSIVVWHRLKPGD